MIYSQHGSPSRRYTERPVQIIIGAVEFPTPAQLQNRADFTEYTKAWGGSNPGSKADFHFYAQIFIDLGIWKWWQFNGPRQWVHTKNTNPA